MSFKALNIADQTKFELLYDPVLNLNKIIMKQYISQAFVKTNPKRIALDMNMNLNFDTLKEDKGMSLKVDRTFKL